jgi:cephalosporin hydroxylase
MVIEEKLDTRLTDILPIIQSRIMNENLYFGIKSLKNPLDLWIYQEIIFSIKPDIIIEIGNGYGGSLLAIAHFFDHMNHGKVIGVDIGLHPIHESVKKHPRIILKTGDACALFKEVKGLIDTNDTVMIIEDSSHEYDNTINILRKYGGLVSVNSYFIIEDSICHHGLDIGPIPGPYEAITDFLKEDDRYICDRSKESFLITWNPKGYLKRIK